MTSPTQTEANRALFAFYGSDVAGAYYIYCYSSQKWLGYDNTNSDTNMRNVIQLSESKADAAYFRFTFNTENGYYDIVPYNATGVASKYLNWNGGTDYNPLDGTNTLGLWQQNGAADPGSRWIFAEVIVSDPISDTWNFTDNDAATYTKAEDIAADEINYTRNYAHTGWQALYVPFDIPYDEISDNFDVSYPKTAAKVPSFAYTLHLTYVNISLKIQFIRPTDRFSEPRRQGAGRTDAPPKQPSAAGCFAKIPEIRPSLRVLSLFLQKTGCGSAI